MWGRLGEGGGDLWTLHWERPTLSLWLGRGSLLHQQSSPLVGGAVDVSWGRLDTCPLTDGPQSGESVLPSPTQVLSGVGPRHLPHCNAQLPDWPPPGSRLAPCCPSMCSQPPEGRRPGALQLVAELGQGAAVSPSHGLLGFLPASDCPCSSGLPSLWFQGFALGTRPDLPLPLPDSVCLLMST